MNCGSKVNCGSCARKIEEAVSSERERLLSACDAAVLATKQDTAERCLAIISEQITTPDGFRFPFPEEAAHKIMRELLGWGGM